MPLDELGRCVRELGNAAYAIEAVPDQRRALAAIAA
jgi:hypothetical protein